MSNVRYRTFRMTASRRLVDRAAGWIVNPHAHVGDEELREAIAGRVILVTGASSGIGEAAARRLGAAGATVLLAARSEDRLSAIAAEIEDAGGSAHALPADLADAEQAAALAAAALERFGSVDVLVSNAGKSINRSIAASTGRFHDFRRTIDLNYLGPVQLVLALLPSMRERGAGHIVNMSTAGVLMPVPAGWAAYLASKAAFDVFLRSAAIELAADGVDTTSIYMTLVHTPMSEPNRGSLFRLIPGFTPAEAAELVCHAVVRRPERIAPWWGTPSAIASHAARGVIDGAQRRSFSVGRSLARRRRDEKPS